MYSLYINRVSYLDRGMHDVFKYRLMQPFYFGAALVIVGYHFLKTSILRKKGRR